MHDGDAVMSGVTVSSHVLDTSRGRPAAGVAVRLERSGRDSWEPIADSVTDSDGRVARLGDGPLTPGLFRLVFGTGQYYARRDVDSFYPEVVVSFLVDDGHYHVPLLLSPFGYSTYRGS